MGVRLMGVRLILCLCLLMVMGSSCPLCDFTFGVVSSYAKNNVTIPSIISYIRKVCNQLQQPNRNQCLSSSNQTINIISGNKEAFCRSLALCVNSMSKKSEPLAGGTGTGKESPESRFSINNQVKSSLRKNIDSEIFDSLICVRAINILINITDQKFYMVKQTSYRKYVTLENIVNKIKNINPNANSDIDEIIRFMRNYKREKTKCDISVIVNKY